MTKQEEAILEELLGDDNNNYLSELIEEEQ